MVKEPVPTQYMLEGVKSETFADSEFLGELKKIYENYRVVNITILVENGEEKDLINIGYPFPVFEENDQLIIDSQFPDTLDKIIKIIKDDERFYQGD